MKRIVAVVTALALCSCGLAYSQSLGGPGPNSPSDIYEAKARLMDALRSQRAQPATFDDGVESLLSPALFSDGYHVMTDTTESGTCLHAELSTYLLAFTTRLDFCMVCDSTDTERLRYIWPFRETDDGIVFDDSIRIRNSSSSRPSGRLLELLGQRFQLTRTLGLPACFAPEDLKWPPSAVLYVHGRDLDTLHLGCAQQVRNCLRGLASGGSLVYAGPARIDYDSRTIHSRFYVAITRPDLARHHFITLDEYFGASGDSVTETRCTIHLYPFVRVDNLRSLHGKVCR
jgi:hypothetical protein